MKKEIWSRTKCILSKVAPWLAALVTAGLIVGLVVMCPISWLPKTSEAGTLLGTLLTAQAAVAALTLAVTLFLMQELVQGEMWTTECIVNMSAGHGFGRSSGAAFLLSELLAWFFLPRTSWAKYRQ